MVLKNIGKWLEELTLQNLSDEIVITAFTHPSYKGMVPDANDYERLEYLGDAVLDLVSAEELVRNSHGSEGIMTEQRSAFVNNEYQSQIYDRLEIGQFTRTAMNFNASVKDKANYVESLFGAIFYELGYDKCKNVWAIIQKRMGKNSKACVGVLKNDGDKEFFRELGINQKNAKSMLQELCQKQGLPIPKYTLTGRYGPDHKPVFKVRVNAMSKSFEGTGKSKKIAEINAAMAFFNVM